MKTAKVLEEEPPGRPSAHNPAFLAAPGLTAPPNPPARLTIARREKLKFRLGEDSHCPVPGLVHRYPDRVLLLTGLDDDAC